MQHAPNLAKAVASELRALPALQNNLQLVRRKQLACVLLCKAIFREPGGKDTLPLPDIHVRQNNAGSSKVRVSRCAGGARSSSRLGKAARGALLKVI